MLQHFREQEEELDFTPTKLDTASRELYFYNPEMTIYQIYVRFRAQRRKSLPHFKKLLRGLDKYVPPNRVAYLCARQAGPDGFVTDEDITEAMRKVYSEVINERTGKMEIDAPLGAYKDICRRIIRIGKKLGKDIIIHRVALPPAHGQLLPSAYAELAQEAGQVIRKGLRDIEIDYSLTHKESLAGATMVARLLPQSPKSVQITEAALQRSADTVAGLLARRAKNQS